MPPTTQDDKKPLGFEVDGFDWNQYITHRPIYPPSFYDRIYTYHASLDGNVFDVALDAGAGPGIVAEKLNVAKSRLSSLPSSRFEFLPEKAEESSVTSASVDLVIISMSIQWTDVPAAISEFARVLKSGGTLYIVNYAFCTILDNPKADAICREIVMDFIDRFQKNPEHIRRMGNRALKTMSCGFDNVGFDAHVWKGVKRVFVNCEGDNTKLQPPARFEVDRGANEVGENEERVFVEGDTAWVTQGCDMEWFKQAFTTYEIEGKVEDSREKWMELEESLGGKDKKAKVIWPSVHIFATKR